MKTHNFLLPGKVQAGVSLIELLVSMTIGVVLVLFVSSLYLGSRGSYQINDDSARMQEEGRATMYLLGRNLMQAGFGMVTFSDAGAETQKTAFEELVVVDAGLTAFRACDAGFTDPAAQNFACAAGGTPAFEVSYMVEAYDGNIGAGADCNGQSVLYRIDASKTFSGAEINRYATNRFYLNNGTLFCAGNGNATPQPLLSNVIDMQLKYGVNASAVGVDTTSGYKSVDKIMTTQAEVEALTNKWKNVVRVEVCLEIASPNNVRQGDQTYVNCRGAATTMLAANPDRRLRTVLTGVYTLRNNASPRNFPM